MRGYVNSCIGGKEDRREKAEVEEGIRERAKRNVKCTETRKETKMKTRQTGDIYRKCGAEDGIRNGLDKVE